MDILNKIIEFIIKKVEWDLLSDSGFRDEESILQYVSFHFLRGNLQWVMNDQMEVIGILIAYECDEEEARKRFDWTEPTGNNCIFVAQLASKDLETTKILAFAFLDRFKDEKTTVCIRRGICTTMKAHEVAKKLVSQLEDAK